MKLLEFGTTALALSLIEKGSASHREAERAAARSLVAGLLGCEEVEISHTDAGAPFVDGADLCLSISHSRDIAVAAIDTQYKIGIDVEQARPSQISRIAARVLSDAEMKYYGVSDERLLQAWTLKEALYKAAGAGADFRRDIALPVVDNEKKAFVAIGNGVSKAFDIVFSQTVEVDGCVGWLSVVRED